MASNATTKTAPGAPRQQVTLGAGEYLPEIQLPGIDERALSVYHQSVAGNPMILFLCMDPEKEPATGMLRRLEAERPVEGTSLITITATDLAANKVSIPALGLTHPVLSNMGTDALRLFGMPKEASASHAPRTVVVRPDGRIAAIHDGREQISAAIDQVRDMAAAIKPIPVTGHAPVLLVDNVFPAEFCAFLIDYWRKGEKQVDATVTVDGRSNRDDSIKRRTDHIIRDPKMKQRLQSVLIARLVPELARSLQFQVTGAEDYWIGCYESARKGHFDRHRDNIQKHTKHRRFACTINLNEGYEGGELTFPEFGGYRYKPGIGDAVIFSCGLLHQALPVTDGERFSMLTFFAGKSVGSA